MLRLTSTGIIIDRLCSERDLAYVTNASRVPATFRAFCALGVAPRRFIGKGSKREGVRAGTKLISQERGSWLIAKGQPNASYSEVRLALERKAGIRVGHLSTCRSFLAGNVDASRRAPGESIASHPADIRGRRPGYPGSEDKVHVPGAWIERFARPQRLRVERHGKEPLEQVARRAEVEADDLHARDQQPAATTQRNRNAVSLCVKPMPRVGMQWNQKSFVYCQTCFNEAGGTGHDLDASKGFGMVNRRGDQTAALPQITDRQQRQYRNGRPNLPLVRVIRTARLQKRLCVIRLAPQR